MSDCTTIVKTDQEPLFITLLTGEKFLAVRSPDGKLGYMLQIDIDLIDRITAWFDA